jgi:hypothetical protein
LYALLISLADRLATGPALMELPPANAVPDEGAYQSLIARTAKSRADAKTNKGTILRAAMNNYGIYGPESPYLHRLSIEEMQALDPSLLADKIHQLGNYPHRVFYFGTKGLDYLTGVLDKHHSIPAEWKDVPEKATFSQLPTERDMVYFVHFDMVQAEMMMMTRSESFNTSLLGPANLYNSYFGSGLSSIVFQEIREQKALAYSAYSYFSTPSEADEHHYLRAYVGTQADKLQQASEAMLELLSNMPNVPMQFEASRDAALKSIATDWITGSSIYWSRERARKRGLDYDIRQDVYTSIDGMEFDELEAFFKEHIADKPRTFLVLGNREMVDWDVLESLGSVEELTLEEIFGY